MNEKRIRVGIFFGGSSREREVSFAGGRTVYDNLDKALFEPVPLFVDAQGHFVELNWPFIYRGTIRDFYPPAEFVDDTEGHYQIYSESLGLSEADQLAMLRKLGKIIYPHELHHHIDIAFLALHGSFGEDGTIQGLLEWCGIPYTGSGILASAFGVNKAVQKAWMQAAGFPVPNFSVFHRTEWDNSGAVVYRKLLENLNYPLVVKSATQGSSIGVTILRENDYEAFSEAVDSALFRRRLRKSEWENLDQEQFIRNLTDLRGALGFPLYADKERVVHPAHLQEVLDKLFTHREELMLQAEYSENEVVVEEMLQGKEFSCIVIGTATGQVIALPPTEIVKKKDLFDYRSKYLPGLSRKVTPIRLPEEQIRQIRAECSRLYEFFRFEVYARIDGFIDQEGRIFLNDPNTTSGMMPSSFFFHQAAEIGLNPSQFLSFIIHNSLQSRSHHNPAMKRAAVLSNRLGWLKNKRDQEQPAKKRVAVIMGGYSSERHISVESGRNIYEKLSSSVEFLPIPVFLTGNGEEHALYTLPVQILLKDNADDIRQKVEHFHEDPILAIIREEASEIRALYAPENAGMIPVKISYHELADMVDMVFIALHGRPGEDGEVQRRLDALGVPYNGSGVESSALTINKYQTNKLLREAGFLVADHCLIEYNQWWKERPHCLDWVNRIGYPVIAKPTDEGCSSAVLKLKNEQELEWYAALTFREGEELDPLIAGHLGLDIQDEFPRKRDFLIERFTDRAGAETFLEITGGMLTHLDSDGNLTYEVFEPSEALSEGEVLSLSEKFLAGEGQNITPARFSPHADENARISLEVRKVLERVAQTLHVRGYCRIDAFVRIKTDRSVEVIIIEVNSLPGMTPATCIYHQASINGYKPFDFIRSILEFAEKDKSDTSNEEVR